MKIPTTTILALLLAAGSTAQDGQAELKERLSKKLAAGFLQNGNWFTDFDQAKVAARKQEKVIFAYFTRSFAP